MNKKGILYSITEVDSDFIGGTPDKILDGLNEGTNYINYDFKNHRYLITFISDNFNAFDKIEEDRKEIEHLQNLIDKTTNYYLKTLAKNGNMSDEAVEMYNLLEESKR